MENSPTLQSVLKSINYKCKTGGCKGTDYCLCVRELWANRPSHELVGSRSGYDQDQLELHRPGVRFAKLELSGH